MRDRLRALQVSLILVVITSVPFLYAEKNLACHTVCESTHLKEAGLGHCKYFVYFSSSRLLPVRRMSSPPNTMTMLSISRVNLCLTSSTR
jgi:hypothetical protein